MTISLPTVAQEVFQAQPLSRLFTYPTGRPLKSMEIVLSLGGAYGAMNKGEYLGIASVGLGDVAELEVSTWRLVSNLFSGTTALGTTSLRVTISHEKSGSALPDASVSFRLNPSWSSVEASGSELSSEVRNQVENVEFETHVASLYFAVSKSLSQSITLHGGLFLIDVQTRAGFASLTDASLTSIPDERQTLLSAFIGFERRINPRTFLMGEVGGVPRFNYKLSGNKFEIDQVALINAGVRFYFTQRLSTDAGVKYSTDYDGIADAEINVGLNVGINAQDMIEKIIHKF